MNTNIKDYFKKLFTTKSRFYFNLSFKNLFLKLLIFYFKKNTNFKEKVQNKLKQFFPKSDIELFNHGRSALYAIFLSIKKEEKRKKIIVNSLTLFEIINVIIYAGYEPIFIDTQNKNSFHTNIIDLIEKNKKTLRGVIVTHLNGANKEIIDIRKKLDEINSVSSEKDKIYLIEDCAVSFGAKINKKFIGSFGDYSILSFNIMKNITSITGGALIDNCKQNNFNFLLNKFKYLKKNDLSKKILFAFLLYFLNSRIIFPFFFIFIKIAYRKNYNFFLKKYRTDFKLHRLKEIPQDFVKLMSNFQAFILLDQFESLTINSKKRIDNCRYLYEKLKLNKHLSFPQTDFDERNIFIDFPVICSSEYYKNKLWELSLKNMIDIKNYYYSNCGDDDIYAEYKDNSLENSYFISKNIFMLPVNVNQKKTDLDKLINLFKND